MQKKILFLSIMDFTDKGIQVVKLTPEYFVKKGWSVSYLVTRDNATRGSYAYQEIVNPQGVNVHRLNMPQIKLFDKLQNHTLSTIYSKLRGYGSIIKLAWYGYKIAKHENIDVLYGGGPHGVLAAHLLNLFLDKKRKVVARFYGTFMYEKLSKKSKKELLFNWDEYLAFKFSADLMLITNDGTQGDKALAQINKANVAVLQFLVNGVAVEKSNTIAKSQMAYTVCRMTSWKRVDRAIGVVDILVNRYKMSDFQYHVIGEGEMLATLKKMALDLQLEKNIIFHGATKHEELGAIIDECSICFSTYDVSNVGNPLLEAIRANKIIFTLNNGDTSSWIQHKENGFIYDIDENLYENMAQDVFKLLEDGKLREKIVENIKHTEESKLWSWDERLEAEYMQINKLVQKQ